MTRNQTTFLVDPREDSRSWLTLMTPLTAIVLVAAMFFVIRGQETATSPPTRQTQATRPLPPAPVRAPMTDQPYVMVLVSSTQDAITAPGLVTIPDAYIDVRVVATAEDRHALNDILIEIRSMRLPAMLSEPIVLDARRF